MEPNIDIVVAVDRRTKDEDKNEGVGLKMEECS
jgi:hypothetical protein